jgi:glycosyltransferase 2 family protein
LIKTTWRGLLGVALTVALLWWAFHGVHWAEVRHAVATANPLLVLSAVVLGTCIFPLRAFRWRPILDPVAPNLPYGALWRATAIGMMANNLLPGRAGEIVRAYALSKETTVPFSAGFASIVVDRVFDAVIVLLLMVGAMFAPSFPSHQLIAGRPASNYAGTGVFVVVVLAVGVYTIVFFPDRLIGLFEAFARRVAPRFEERGRRLLRSFADGLGVLRHPRRFAVVFAWALALWLVQPVAFWVMFRALGIDVPFAAAVFLQGLIVFGVAVPSTPGYFGPFEVAAVAGLAIYGVSNTLAVAWALSFHILSLLPITLIGLYYLARTGLHLGELKDIKR